MKIAVIGTRGFPNVQGGVEAHCEMLYPILVEFGCDVTVFTRRPYVDPTIKDYKSVHLRPVNCPKNKSLEAIIHSIRSVFLAKKTNPDVLHVHAIGPSLVIPIARILGLKVVMTNHGPDYKRKKWGRIGRLTLRFGEYVGSKWANEVICISNTIADHIGKKYKRKVHVIPNGVVIPKMLDSKDALDKYGLSAGRYALAVGRFVPEKGFHDLIDAFNESKIVDWKLVIVGRADHEDNYSHILRQKAQTNQNIVMTGFLTGLPLRELYSHAGLFVLPSYYEGLPIVLLEAMSYGVSCIASDIPGNKELELEGNRYFEAGDISGLAEKLKEFSSKPLDLNEKQKQIDVLRQKYDWKDIAAKTFQIYKIAIGQKNKERD